MEANNEIKKLEIKIKNLEDYLNSITSQINFKFEILDKWSVTVGSTLTNMALGVDKIHNELFNYIIYTDNNNRNETNRILRLRDEKSIVLLKENNEKNEKVDIISKEITEIKKLLKINLLHHKELYDELEEIWKKTNNVKKDTIKMFDNFLSNKYKLDKNKERKKQEKGKLIKITCTLPTYIRHHFSHKRNSNNPEPTQKEIEESIQILLKILWEERT